MSAIQYAFIIKEKVCARRSVCVFNLGYKNGNR
jgi:hypothetical protein